MNSHPARLIIYKDRVETTNASNYRVEGVLDPEKVVPFSKNPVIAKFFAQLSWVEEIGSGMMNIGKYLHHYTPDGVPKYMDGPIFTTAIPLSFKGIIRENVGKTSGKRRENVGKTSGKILQEIEKNDTITIPELALFIGVTERSIERNIQKLQSDGLLRRTGGRKQGRWEII
jgi:ATP-dependent DNA helicase RecG